MDTFALKTAYQMTKLDRDIHQLLALDDAWTQYLAEARTLNAQDIKILNSIVSDMDRLLVETQEVLSAELAKIVEAGDLELADRIRTACKRQGVSSDQIENILSEFEKLGGNASGPATIKSNLERQIPIERKEILCKIAIINSGLYTPGDMSKEGKCYLGWACLGAGAGLGAWPVAAAGVILIADNC